MTPQGSIKEGDEMSSHERGMAIRRQVLGADHVDRALAATTDLDADFQAWITDNVWGYLWTRPEIDLRDRSMVTIAILGALNHEELELHLRAARNTGVRPEEISEVLLHVAVYAGVPAANRAFKVMKSIYEETEQ
ncbi:MAG: 4-carboxymuconolactone decarboxylase [Acidimicrobiia bacterium]|jgi:4-carboxymuconolactone decarboxylase